MLRITFFIILLATVLHSNSQGFLRVNGTDIVNDNGIFISKSIGTGNWMIMEGYMMQSTSARINTHTQFRTKLESIIGEEKTTEFYNNWLQNHFTKADLDSMKAWGFNSLRPALHYKWFTLPIEDEPNKGENTWLEIGFTMLDSLLSWAADNQMYIFLDMHGTPGGQGKNADISDYNPDKPSLWESTENQDKLVALWVEIAERYKNNPWVGGYDFINEPNWNVDGAGNDNGCGCKNNDAIWDLHLRLTKEVRKIDKKHIVFLSGNCWGNNYGSFNEHPLNSYDSNTAITFHKYWNVNNQEAIQQFIDMRKKYNRPLWMSESGENSNQWFADAIHLFESNNIGWSWWPVKKSRINNIFKVTTPDSYKQLIESWKDGNTPLATHETLRAVMDYSEAHKTQNCEVAPDVIFAMQQGTDTATTKAFKNHKVDEWILFADYDYGRDGHAYHDMVSENIHANGQRFRPWNEGYSYRNDGVDIGINNDQPFVGWTEQGEWLQFTFTFENEGKFKIKIESAATDTAGQIEILTNNKTAVKALELPVTTADFKWEITNSNEVNVQKGENKIRFKILKGGSKLYRFKLEKI